MSATAPSDAACAALLRRRRPPRFDHGAPLSRASSLPILLFVLSLLAALTAFNGRAQHVLTIDLPAPLAMEDTGQGATIDRLRIDRNGQFEWNGRAVTQTEFEGIARDVGYYPKVRRLEFAPDADAPYGAAFAALGILWKTGLTQEGFCFHSASTFGRWETMAARSTESGTTGSCAFNHRAHSMPVSLDPSPRRSFWSLP